MTCIEIRMRIAFAVEKRLPLADHAQRGIVDDADLDIDPLEAASGQFLVSHLEGAVPVDHPDCFVGLSDFGSHGSRDSESHGPRASRAQPLSWVFEVQELIRPHLMLADAGNVDGVVRPDGFR